MGQAPWNDPWNDWYHCTGTTYGKWLPGSDWGFRTRHHRRHIEGDYKNPPPPGMYAEDLARSKRLMKREAVCLVVAARRLACDAMFASLCEDGIEVIAVAVNGVHFHLLARFPDRDPRYWIGRAKGRAARALAATGLAAAGGVWAKRCKCKPIADRAHQMTVVGYIRDHVREGAAVRVACVNRPDIVLPKPTA